MASESEFVDVWLCRFPSKQHADSYFEETYGDDDEMRPISPFAADMGQLFYDHDVMERGAFYDPPISDVSAAIAPHSYSTSYLAEVNAAFRSKPFVPFNFVLLFWDQEIEHPASIAKPEHVLHYLGRFKSTRPAKPTA